MRKIVGLALAALALSVAAPAFADVPGPFNWSLPARVILVGHGPAGPDSATGHVTCVIRDLAGNPVAGATVDFDFSACSDVTIATDQRDPRLTVDCLRKTVSTVTDEDGIARLTVLGAGAAGPVHPPQSFRIYADGVLGGYPILSVLERDGVGGLTLADLAFWAADFFAGTSPERADLDGSGYVNIADLSVWAAAYFSGNNAQAIGAVCP